MKLSIKCDRCGKELLRYPSQIHRHNFCSRECLNEFSSKAHNADGYAALKDYTHMSENMSRINKQLNPTRMTPEVRRKIHEAKVDIGKCTTYRKSYGQHEHRRVAEAILGRPLVAGEVVHHIDGNKRNNEPYNILILSSQSEHAQLHARWNKIFAIGGDAT